MPSPRASVAGRALLFQTEQQEGSMEGLILLAIAILIGVAYGFYRSGKRVGSRKGYGVGRAHRRRRR